MFNQEETINWWKNTIADDAALQRWLQKLYRTELSGYTDHLTYLGKQGSIEERTSKILLNVALDELKHSHILKDLLSARGVELGNPPESEYWKVVNSAVENLEDYCAVNHYGESLAAFRFEVIESCPETPSDIKEAIRIILPDEIFHRVTLEKIAGDSALQRMRIAHENAVQRLRK